MFGLEWEPLEALLEPFLDAKRRSGARSYVLAPSQDLVGLSQQTYPSGASSAALYLADAVSQGGRELYVLEFSSANGQAQECGVVALIDKMPVPGFDRVVSPTQVADLIEEFHLLQAGQNALLFSNMANLPGAKPLRPTLFTTSVSEAHVHRLRNKKAMWLGVLVLFVCAGLGYWAYRTYEEEQHLMELQRQQQASDPNLLYEQAIQPALNNTGEPGINMLRRWQDTIDPIPIWVKGWRMESFICDQQACRVNWAREHGSIADFSANLPAGAALQPFAESAKQVSTQANWVLSPVLTTTHPLKGARATPVLVRELLPLANDAVKEMSDFLQDISLLGSKDKSTGTTYGLTLPITFGMPGAVAEQLKKPVESGSLSFPLSGGDLKMITLPGYVVLRELSLAKQSSIHSIADSVLSIKGDYYAKGK
ncbi:type 4b pilus protein PilO2 [Actimicrobium sp. CCI2.3]|uniref:type 4b pilus protein PilO2 n=1 Tax=Actimicrobium sp. CCI2.3 TaxID=3048616 RepID=UPI002AB4C568|nr:type 4b pilus protein PilO2 [Actimicrobium sp. CCI2.3]MDY7574216.1 type 4b pilus protein PilO2 [Actimicrobium sp. CCI2.3]MEB0022784.1 type 4b pilus protein PilO2 [Actimicrobium sp. CCI2.3]